MWLEEEKRAKLLTILHSWLRAGSLNRGIPFGDFESVIAKEQDDEEAFQKISSIIKREHQQNFWRKLNFVTGKKRTRSETSIQVEGKGGIIMEHTTQDTVEKTIFSEVHEKRYTLAGEAPICNGELFEDLGYQATTKAAMTVLDGTYDAPTTSDKATRDLFAEIAATRRLIPKT